MASAELHGLPHIHPDAVKPFLLVHSHRAHGVVAELHEPTLLSMGRRKTSFAPVVN